MNTFHRSFIRRIAFACILVSVLAGLVGLLLEMMKMDRMAECLARQEAARLITRSKGSEPPPPEALDQWQDLARRTLKEKGYIQRLSLAALLSTLVSGAVLYPLLLSLHRRSMRFSEDLASANLELASVLGSAIAQRDSGTGSHNFRVTLYAIRLGLEVEDPALDMRALILGAFLHDVGKIGVHDAILLKPGPLTAEERVVMCSHVERGVAIIESSTWLHLARNVIECHHERFDGKGYPRGIEGRDIPLEARIFAIVDVFDALTSERPYKPPFPLQEVLATLEREAGSHFDPNLLARFSRIAAEAFQDIGEAADFELETRLKAWVDQHRSFLHGDRPVARNSLSGIPRAVPKCPEEFA